MAKNQIMALVVAILVLVGLYFVPITPPQNKEVEANRALAMEATDKVALLKRAKEKYDPSQLAEVMQLTDRVVAADTDTAKLAWLERLSGAWYRLGEAALAGIYAEEIAEIRQDDESWSIAGTTFGLGVRNETEERIQLFCRDRAVKAFDKAISLNPQNEQHRINKALCYVELPLSDNPMKGILMLRNVLDQNPESVPALTQLGSLAIQTRQYEKAVERLEYAHSLSKDNKKVIQLLVQAYEGMGNKEKSLKYQELLEN